MFQDFDFGHSKTSQGTPGRRLPFRSMSGTSHVLCTRNPASASWLKMSDSAQWVSSRETAFVPSLMTTWKVRPDWQYHSLLNDVRNVAKSTLRKHGCVTDAINTPCGLSSLWIFLSNARQSRLVASDIHTALRVTASNFLDLKSFASPVRWIP